MVQVLAAHGHPHPRLFGVVSRGRPVGIGPGRASADANLLHHWTEDGEPSCSGPTGREAVAAFFAYWWIRQAMTRALHTRARLIRLPINTFELLYKAERVQAEHLSKTGSPLPLPELATLLKVTPERLAAVYDASASTECLSLDAPTEVDGSNCAFMDIAVNDNPSAPTTLDLPDFLELLSNPPRAQQVLAQLSSQERHILQALYFEDRTTRSIADELSLTPAQVRHIASKACRNLRPLLADPIKA